MHLLYKRSYEIYGDIISLSTLLQSVWTGFDHAKFCDIFLCIKDTSTIADIWAFHHRTQILVFFPWLTLTFYSTLLEKWSKNF